MERYKRNKNLITDEEQVVLAQKKVCILGVGGLGGYLSEMAVRLGILSLTIIDKDSFDVTNLNRQLFSLENNIGQPKTTEAKNRLKSINSQCKITAIQKEISSNNLSNLLIGYDVILDGLDNLNLRKEVALACRKLNIPFIHGAIAGWYGQVAVLLPEGNLYKSLFKSLNPTGVEKDLGNTSFTPACIASIQIAEMLKYLLQKKPPVEKLIFIDLLSMEIETIYESSTKN